MTIGVDIGGTKTLVAALDSRGILEPTQRFETLADPEATIEKMVSAIKKIPDWREAQAIVIGAPGKIQPLTRVLLACGNLPWVNLDLAQIIAMKTGLRCFVENDAKLAGLAEVTAHDLMSGTVLYLTVSTGIGSAVLENGLLVGALSQSEAGQMMLKQGDDYEVWEKFASGHALYELYDKKAKDIFDDAIWYRVSEALLPGLLPLLATVQPRFVIIGGSIGTYFDRYHHHLKALLEEHNQSTMVNIPQFIGAKHAEEAVLYGCFVYGTQHN